MGQEVVQEKPKNKLLFKILLGVVLLVQLAVMFYWGTQKQGYHIDEMHTYELSTYEYVSFYSNLDNYIQWYDGSYFLGSISADGDELFNFSRVNQNQMMDVHPPLYYYIINIAMSLFEGVHSKWIGIVPNMVIAMITTVVMYLLALRLMKKRSIALLVAAFFALNIGTMSTVIFIRMYAMLTMWVVALLYYHLKAFDEFIAEKISIKTFVARFVVTWCGILTHYYFLSICFFFCGALCVYLLCKKAYKALFQYAAVELAALLAAFLYFPTAISHVFLTGRGAQAFENLVGAENYFSSMRAVFTMVGKSVFGGFTTELIVLLGGLGVLLAGKAFVAYTAKRKVAAQENSDEVLAEPAQQQQAMSVHKRVLVAVGVLSLVVIGYIAIVARVAPYCADRYYMCVYPLILLCVLAGLVVLLSCLVRNQTVVLAVTAAVCIVVTALTYQTQEVAYLCRSEVPRAEALAEYLDTPVVVINGGYGNSLLSYLPEIAQYDEVFVCHFSDFDYLTLANADGKLDDGFVFYIINLDFTQDERLWLLDYYLGFSSCEEIATDVYYCTK